MRRIYRFLLLWLLLGVQCVMAQTAVPPLSAAVMDEAQMLTPAYRAQLERQLLDYSQRGGSQIVVLTVAAVAPETPFDYGTRVFEQWKIGRKGIDDGVLLLVVRDEHKTQILVGRGLEGAIPDAYAKRILDNEVMPRFRAGDMDGGVGAAVARLQELIAGEKLPDATASQGQDGHSGLFVLFLAPFFALILKAIFGTFRGSVFTGTLLGIVGALLGLSLLMAVLLAFLAFVFALLPFSATITMAGGGSGGGGFSGGGGGFGGGGASGGW